MIGKFPENSMPDGCKCQNSSRFFPHFSLSVVRVHRTLHRGVAHRPPHGLYGTWCQTRQEILLFQNWILRHDTSASIVCKLQPRKEHRRAKWNVVRWIWLGDFTRRQSRVWMDQWQGMFKVSQHGPVCLRLRRGDRLSPRAAKHYRPSSAQVTYGGFELASCVTFNYGNFIVDKSDNLHFFDIII